MRRFAAITGIAAATLVGSAVFSPSAAAGGVGWSVSVGVPGVAISAGAPAYWGRGYRHVYAPYYRAHYRPYYRPYYRAYLPAPVVYPAPIVTYAYPAPVYVAPRVVLRY